MNNHDPTSIAEYRDASYTELKPRIETTLPPHHPGHTVLSCLEEVAVEDGYSHLQGKVRLRELNEAVDWHQPTPTQGEPS